MVVEQWQVKMRYLDTTGCKLLIGLKQPKNTIPSKYAARIAQAFSGTDPSVRIRRNQWDDQLADLGTKPFWHTDGQGTISVGLRDEIWDVLVKAQPDKAKLILKPSAVRMSSITCIFLIHLLISCL